MKGQSSIELLLVITVAMLLCALVLGRFMSVQDGVFTSASARQQLVASLEGLDTKYDVNGIAFAECSEDVRVNVAIRPNPKGVGTAPNTEDTLITPAVQDAVKSTRNLGAKAVCVSYNDPASLNCQNACGADV